MNIKQKQCEGKLQQNSFIFTIITTTQLVGGFKHLFISHNIWDNPPTID